MTVRSVPELQHVTYLGRGGCDKRVTALFRLVRFRRCSQRIQHAHSTRLFHLRRLSRVLQ